MGLVLQLFEMSSTANPPTIFGYQFADIDRAQQGGLLGRGGMKPVDRVGHKAQIERDIARFRIPVDADVVAAYRLELPVGYALSGGVFVFSAPAS